MRVGWNSIIGAGEMLMKFRILPSNKWDAAPVFDACFDGLKAAILDDHLGMILASHLEKNTGGDGWMDILFCHWIKSRHWISPSLTVRDFMSKMEILP